MADKRISELPDASPFTGGEKVEAVQGGVNVKFDPDYVNHARGDWAGTSAFPATGGTFTGGVPARGNRWRLTDTLVIGSDVYAPGTIIEAAINTPGQTTGNWIKYSMQP